PLTTWSEAQLEAVESRLEEGSELLTGLEVQANTYLAGADEVVGHKLRFKVICRIFDPVGLAPAFGDHLMPASQKPQERPRQRRVGHPGPSHLGELLARFLQFFQTGHEVEPDNIP